MMLLRYSPGRVSQLFAVAMLLFLLLWQSATASAEFEEVYPRLLLTADAVVAIRQEALHLPLMQRTVEQVIASAQKALSRGMDVPVPVDPGGGYTHERHKQLALDLQACGQAWQLTGDPSYLVHATRVFEAYAELYPTLGLHPARANQAAGRLFWQVLNETVWLVQAIQGYDCIVEDLDPRIRQRIEHGLFRPMVSFLLNERAETFNRIHNHATWATAAVGMTGLVLGEDSWVEMALKGSRMDGETGFLKQIETLFSQDGYYAEGPYYQRYSLLPFLAFALALDHNRPGMEIFRHRNGVLLRAVDTLLQMTNDAGEFFPINNSIKGKSWMSPELVNAISIAYTKGAGLNPQLLDIAARHGQVLLSAEGLQVARDVAAGRARPFERKSVVITDGPDGDAGGLVLLRGSQGAHSAGNPFEVLFKATSQGMGHGHFDRLSVVANAGASEVLRDYGSARWVNVVQKQGGRYLPENQSWAKQSVAHHTVVLGQRSHFDADLKRAEESNPRLLWTSIDSPSLQAVMGEEAQAYPGWHLRRSLVRIEPEAGIASGRVLLLDVIEGVGASGQPADLPLYYGGDFIGSNFPFQDEGTLRPLGSSAGYEHLWLTGRSIESLPPTAQVTWMQGNRFYTWSTRSVDGASMAFTLSGANDPEFNLRRESGLLFRQPATQDVFFCSVLEAHGRFHPETELVVDSQTVVQALEVLHRDATCLVVGIRMLDASSLTLYLAREDDPERLHERVVDGRTVQWKGNLFLETNE
jgi:oligo-alginate lyase